MKFGAQMCRVRPYMQHYVYEIILQMNGLKHVADAKVWGFFQKKILLYRETVFKYIFAKI